MAIAKIRSFLDSGLKSVSSPADRSVNLEPELGLRIVHSPSDKTLRVTVLGARHLPQNFGFTRVNCYIVKVKILPGKEKFETTSRNESWPSWNEEFVFHLRKESKGKFGKTKVVEEEINAAKFVTATLFAVLEDKPLIATEKKENALEKTTSNKASDGKSGKTESKKESKSSSKKENVPIDNKSDNKQQQQQTKQEANKESKNKFLSSIFGKGSSDKVAEPASSERKAFKERRTIGATTVALDPAIFTTKPMKAKHSGDMSTGDLWKTLKPIASGIAGAEDRRENKKGQVELSLCQEKSDKKDVSGGRLVLTLLKLRCSLHTMHEHEALKGQLYVKMTVIDNNKVVRFWKSERFDPCVTMKFDDTQARILADNPYEGALSKLSFVIKFVSKNKTGKKTTIGQLTIGPDASGSYGEQWKQALAKPGHHVVKWQAFE